MKVLIIGGSGMLGHKLVQSWKNKFETYATLKAGFAEYEKFEIFDKDKTFANVDVEEFSRVEQIIMELKPQVIMNAVGIIKQIPSAKNVVKTLTINSIFPHRLQETAAAIGARVITVSTDCVFDGMKGNYIESDISNATDLYGKSKNLGEISGGNSLTLRTSIIGRELHSSHSLVEWILSNRGKTVKGYVNAIYTGFPTIELADIIADLIENNDSLKGLYHVSSDPINKYELIKLVTNAYGAGIEIEKFEDFRIDRSLDSTKFREETGFVPKNWLAMIDRMAQDETPYEKWRK